MVEFNAKSQAAAWGDALQNGKEPSISDLAKIIFGLSDSEVRLYKLGDGLDKKNLDLGMKKSTCLKLLNDSLLQNCIGSL